ncbi:hypothetical protein DFH08DRAFT_960262 [Mycena albidolilacea]|uniref:Uncharacterized protein n=1 Tax=Mycena albidolilacea TaxID=1033008 RepID=A0AAD7A331_9AGAR|nr:hypothetical protein DFH08DRAFT_960262 [Mycena albidolilacea]
MCDNPSTIRSALLFWMLSFVPSNILPYITLGVASISLVVYYVQLNLPSLKLNRLKNTIGMTEDIITRAKADCGMRDHLLLVEGEIRLLRVKLSTSRIHSRLLETHSVCWITYLQNMITISRNLAMSERELQDIRTSLLLLIEGPHQHKLGQTINGSQEIEHSRVLQSQRSCRTRVGNRDVGLSHEV